MVIANFINKQDALVTGLDQYDYGQVLRIQGLNLPTAVEIHFGLEETGGTTTTRIGVTKDGVTDVPIPDSMLENGDTSLDYTIYAFVYLTDETSGKTVHRIKMQVKARSKPELLNKPEDKELFQKAIEAVNQSAKEAEGWAHGREDMPERAADNAKYYAGESAKSAESVKGVEQNVKDMVATIGGIEQQVQDVKEFAGQAKTAAENALLSEQEAKKSEGASLQHRTGAETAENNAEMAEQNAKKSEQAVEQAKQLVMQMGQEVLNNKNQVAEKVEAFNKVVTDASDSIETIKTDAMDAVGTKGTEQTQKVSNEGAKQVKAVEGKGNEVLQSIPQDFTTQMESKLDKQQGSENKGKALVVGDDGNVTVGEVQGGDGIPIINDMSGESPLVVPDSAERVNKGFELLGKSEQASTNGLNLFNYKDFVDPNTYDVKDGSYYRKYLRLKPNTKYTVTVFNDITDNSLTGIFFIGATAAHDSSQANGYITAFNTNGKHSVSFNTGEDGLLVMKALGNATKLEEKFLRVDLIISEGNEIPYEPYTGGKPSPSPDYPQEIKNVGKWNEEKQKYEVKVKIFGKNRYSVEAAKKMENWQVSEVQPTYKDFAIYIGKGKTFTLSFSENLKELKSEVVAGVRLVKSSGINKWIYDGSICNNVYTTKAVEDYIYLSSNALRIEYFVNDIKSLQIEISDEPTEYQPYKEQMCTLSLDQPLRGIGDYKDEVTKDGIIRKVVSEINNTLDSFNGWNSEAGSYRSVFVPKNKPANDKNNRWVCNMFNEIGTTKNNNQIFLYYTKENLIAMGIDPNGTKDEANVKLKEFISQNPFTFEYALAEPITEPLPDDFKLALDSLKTYYPTTVITVDGGEVIPSVELTYTADTKNFILNREKAMQAQMLNIQSALISQKISGGV